MWLLHSSILELRDFPNHEDIPYAILSHTWAEEEVLFHDIDGFNATTIPDKIKQKLGFKKIEACCAQARGDGFEYVWIDTCCIDKRSSAELSEAINSMFRWYQDSAVCYAYLADVSNDVTPELQEQMFRKSRWFTRGWTLQELIGPLNLEFYGDNWHAIGQGASLGTKRSLRSEISQITRIPEDAFIALHHIVDYCIAQRMSWAAHRSTTRIEDRAYCLMGLFGINMPLLYGEGNRAFLRLQEEIMKVSMDESLFAWALQSFEDRHQWVDDYGTGLLAISADCFVDSNRVIKKILNRRNTPFAVTNKGLRLEVTLLKATYVLDEKSLHPEDWIYGGYGIDDAYTAVLNCIDQSSDYRIAILLARSRNVEESDQFFRLNPTRFELISPSKHYFQQHRYLQPHSSSTIYIKISERYGLKLALGTAMRHLTSEWDYETLMVKEITSGFRIVNGTLNEFWTMSEDCPCVTKLEAFKRYFMNGNYQFSPLELFIEDDTEQFVLLFTYYQNLPRIQLLPNISSGCSNLQEVFRNVRSRLEESGDRATCMLSSQRTVVASLRSERWGGEACFTLRIAVTVIT